MMLYKQLARLGWRGALILVLVATFAVPGLVLAQGQNGTTLLDQYVTANVSWTRTVRMYIRRIEELTETEVTLVSVGEKRAETILRRNPFRQSPRRS